MLTTKEIFNLLNKAWISGEDIQLLMNCSTTKSQIIKTEIIKYAESKYSRMYWDHRYVCTSDFVEYINNPTFNEIYKKTLEIKPASTKHSHYK